MTIDNLGIKHDAGKDPWHLAPWDAFRAIVKVLAFGAQKYGDRNWERGMDYSRVYRAAIDHLTAWWNGEGPDKETGFSHLWHAGCCVCFLIAYEQRKIGTDDRPLIAPAPRPAEDILARQLDLPLDKGAEPTAQSEHWPGCEGPLIPLRL